MAGKNIFCLELEPGYIEFDMLGMVLWSTTYYNYQFVNSLNRLLSVDMRREIPLELVLPVPGGERCYSCPCFSYADEAKKMIWYSIDLPKDHPVKYFALNQYDKLVLFYGERARQESSRLYSSFESTHSTPPADEPRMVEWMRDWDCFVDGGVLAVERLHMDESGDLDATFLTNFTSFKPKDYQKVVKGVSDTMDLIRRALSPRIIDITSEW